MRATEMTTLDPRWARAPWPARQAYLRTIAPPRPVERVYTPRGRDYSTSQGATLGRENRAIVAAALEASPDASTAELCEETGLKSSTVRSHIRAIRKQASE